jgi:hypothetical protein
MDPVAIMAAFGHHMFCIARSESSLLVFFFDSHNESFNNLRLPPTAHGDSDVTQSKNNNDNTNNNAVALVRERTIPTERPPLVGEISATFADRRCRVVSATDPYGHILGFLDRSHHFFFQVAHYTHEAEWTPFQTHYLSENLVAPEIERGPLDL